MIFGPALSLILFAAGGILFVLLGKSNPLLHPIRVVKALFSKNKSSDGISPFKAMTVALAGTLGVGNIAGVATAITAGGAGAVFWLLVSSFAAMILKYCEIVLAVLYRKKSGEGYHGGAVYYIKNGLKSPFTASLFAVICIIASFSLGSIVQVNAAAEAISYSFNIPPLFVGILMAVLVFFVIIGGVKSVANVTVKLIPLLSAIYIIFSMYVIVINCDKIPAVFSSVISSAFDTRSAVGGILGFITSKAIRIGISRGVFSNEAGCGTAPFAHASAHTNSAVEQGFFGIFEVFADTALLCTMTALVILIPYGDISQYDGMVLAIKAFECYIGPVSGYFIAISAFLFAFAAVICWSHYSCECLKFLFPKKNVFYIYCFLYSAAAIYGSVAAQGAVWEIADLTVSLMTVINTATLMFLFKQIKSESVRYFSK